MKDKATRFAVIGNSIIIVILLGLGTYVTIKYWSYFQSLQDPINQAELKVQIQSYGFWGFFLLLGLQIFQIVIAFIPGEITEILSGVMYGAFWGTILCLLGIAIATIIIYYLVKWLGRPFQKLFVSNKVEEKFAFLRDVSKVEAAYLFVFLIPATPKDALIYLAAPLKVKLSHFLLISVLGRIPSVLLSTLLGSAVISSNGVVSVAIMAITIVMAALGIIFYRPIFRFIHKLFYKEQSS